MAQPAVSFEGVTLGYGPRRVWSKLSLPVSPRSFLAILGPHGARQTPLLTAGALGGEPRLLLCDEPLASLDLHHQREITDLIAAWRRDTGGTVLFVTHDVNPVLHLVDRVVFVVNGRWAEGTPDEVLTSERMSDLYGSHVDVVRVHGRVLVVGQSTEAGLTLHEPHPMPEPTLVGHPADRPEP